jgi:hypothetical protein
MSFVDHYLLYFRQLLITSPFWPFCLSSFCLLKVCIEISFFPPLTLCHTSSHSVPLLCVSFQFLVYCSVFFFFLWGSGLSAQGLCWFILRVVGEKLREAWCSPGGLPNVSQAGLEPTSDGMAAPLFSQCDVVWRSFPQARGSGCWSFDSPCCFISSKSGSSVSVRFWSLRAHTVCFCAIVAILDQSLKSDFEANL